MVWNDESIRHLRDLWAEGLSTAEIGRRLGVTKNAIVGKAHRLDLDARPSPIRRDMTRPQPQKADTAPRPAGPTLPPLPSAQPATAAAPRPLRLVSAPPRPVAIARPAAGPAASTVAVASAVPAPARAAIAPAPQPRRNAPVCCWPIGEPGTKSFRFCDGLSMPSKPYCEEHARLAYVRIKDRKDDAA